MRLNLVATILLVVINSRGVEIALMAVVIRFCIVVIIRKKFCIESTESVKLNYAEFLGNEYIKLSRFS